jgi:hypothetical protein
MSHIPSSLLRDYVVSCKACCENFPAPIETMPDTWIVAECPLCGVRRRYLPAEIFQGRISGRLAGKRLPYEAQRWEK